jgi:phosphatidate cytidylyltransferase
MLRTRVITALALLAGFLVILFLLPPLAAAVAFGGVAALAAWEWGGLMGLVRSARGLFAGFVVLSCYLCHEQPEFAWAVLLPLAAAFWLVLVPLWLRRGWRLADNDLGGYLVGWILIVPTWIAMVALHQRSPWLLLAVMSIVWMADIAAYFTGRRFGRHKLAPAISPGKTWEGAGGAVVGVLCYGGLLALLAWVSRPALPLLAGMLVLLTAASILGDLFESLVKRQAGVKDSGNLLPGHGGILDRIDSQTSTLPLAALLLHWLAP